MTPTVAKIRSLFGNAPRSCGAMDAWEAEKHPRGKGGKFAKGSGGASAAAKTAPAKPTPKKDVSAQAHAAAKAKVAENKAKPKKPVKSRASTEANAHVKQFERFKAKSATGPAETKAKAKTPKPAVEKKKKAIVEALKATPAPKSRPLRNRILDAYLKSTGGQLNARGLLVDIRKELPDVDKATLDNELKKLQMEEKALLYPLDNLVGEHHGGPEGAAKIAAHKEAALHIAGFPRHMLWSERGWEREPEDEPIKPKKSTVKKTAAKAVAKPKKSSSETQERADLIAGLRDLGHKPKKTDTTATLKQMLAGGPAPKTPTAKPKAKAAPKAETPAPKAEAPTQKPKSHDVGHRVSFTVPAIVGNGKAIRATRGGIVQSIDDKGRLRVLDQTGSLHTLDPSEITSTSGAVPGEKERIQRLDSLMATTKATPKKAATPKAAAKPKATKEPSATKAAPKPKAPKKSTVAPNFGEAFTAKPGRRRGGPNPDLAS